MARNPNQFALQSRILHWLMAAMLLAMLFIGVAMGRRRLVIITGWWPSIGLWVS